MKDELKARAVLADELNSIMEKWEAFAEAFHGKEYTDGEHAYGVLDLEYRELEEAYSDLGSAIADFRRWQVKQHDYHLSKAYLQQIVSDALRAAEEALQVGAVALKACGSAFVYHAGGKHSDEG